MESEKNIQIFLEKQDLIREKVIKQKSILLMSPIRIFHIQKKLEKVIEEEVGEMDDILDRSNENINMSSIELNDSNESLHLLSKSLEPLIPFTLARQV